MPQDRDSPSTGQIERGLDSAQIKEQLDRLLASPLFRNSKRYPMLLRHIVEKALDGRFDDLKERSIGFEVFQKSPDYDTNNDNVVRITAGEIRKRLALYYQEDNHKQEIRIELPVGAYVPVFHRGELETKSNLDGASSVQEIGASPDQNPSILAPIDASEPGEPHVLEEKSPLQAQPKPRTRPRSRLWYGLALVASFVFGLGAAYLIFRTQHGYGSSDRIVDNFWSQTLSAPGNIQFCLPVMHVDPKVLGGGSEAGNDNLGVVTLIQYDEIMNRVSLADSISLTRLASVAQAQGKNYSILGDKFATLTDLRSGPVVLVGAFDNNWTMRLTEPLRYGFEKNPDTVVLHIRDRQNMNFSDWVLDSRLPYARVSTDYAIVARFQDKTTEQLVVVAAGLGQFGTLAAGEELTNPKYLRALLARAPDRWGGVNFEAVLRTQVISGSNGPPEILASNFW